MTDPAVHGGGSDPHDGAGPSEETSPGSSPDELLAECAAALTAAVEDVLAAWVVRSVEQRWQDYRGQPPPEELHTSALEAGQAACAEVPAALRRLLETDVEEQWTNPLAILRRAVVFPTAVLRAADVASVVRDRFAERAFPEDRYDLSPAAWADIDPALHEPGLRWGAAKAYAVLTRRKGRP